MVNTLCIVQARLTSSRLPNKVITELGNTGLTLLEHTYKRLKYVRNIDEVIFAIPDTPANDRLEIFLNEKKIPCFRGSEENVLKRFYDCALRYHPKVIIRATCDNPCVDFEEASRLIDAQKGFDYAASLNAPLGTAVEVFTAEALYRAYREAHSEVEQEHVTPYLYQHDELFKVLRLPYKNSPSLKLRLTVDTEQDMELMNKIFENLYHGEEFPNSDVYKFLVSNPELLEINAEVKQKTI